MVEKIQFYSVKNIDRLPQFAKLSKEKQFELKVVSQVLPFKVNNYVTDHLIDWDHVDNDPIFNLTFMQRAMLSEKAFQQVADLALKTNFQSSPEMDQVVADIREDLNPHPAGQLESNVPRFKDGTIVKGVQHKYRETVLVFPRQGQTCHSYCTFCFRWPQFVYNDSSKFSTDREKNFFDYLRENKEVTDVLFTGGDPMVMNANVVGSYLLPLLQPEFEHIQNIRIGSKSLTYWPKRYIDDPDTAKLLGIFEQLSKAGKQVSFMAHLNHYREIEGEIPQEAIRNIRNTGTNIRSQSPLIKHINDSADIWVKNWNLQMKLGIVPYYMFIERDTGPKEYFSLPLEKAYYIYKEAITKVSGLSRTARGPSMSAHPGKIVIDGIENVQGEKVFQLRLLQARNSKYAFRPFFAKYDPEAKWLDDLKPAFGESKFFFEEEGKEKAKAKAKDMLGEAPAKLGEINPTLEDKLPIENENNRRKKSS